MARGKPARLVIHDGEEVLLKELLEREGVKYGTYQHRVTKQGMTHEEAIACKRTSKRQIGPFVPYTDEYGYYRPEQFKIVCPNGRVFKCPESKKNRSWPKPGAWSCEMCGRWDYIDLHNNHRPKRCVTCNAIHGSRIQAIKKRLKHSVKQAIVEQCGTCEKPFDAAPKSPDESARKYCSFTCSVRAAKPPRKDAVYVGEYTRISFNTCKVCRTGIVSNRKSNGGRLYCGDTCETKAKELAKIRARETRVNYSHVKRAKLNGAAYEYGINLRKLALRDGMTCQICGERVNKYVHKGPSWQPKAWSIDHIVAINGPGKGSHTWDNVQLACIECNTMKGNRDDYTK